MGTELTRSGSVDFSGALREVNLCCVPDARPGDYVLVHAGLAIARIDEKEAARVLNALEELNEPLLESSAETSETETQTSETNAEVQREIHG